MDIGVDPAQGGALGLATLAISALLYLIRDFFNKSLEKQDRVIELLTDMQEDAKVDRIHFRHRHRQLLAAARGDATPIETKLQLQDDDSADDERNRARPGEYIYTPRKSQARTRKNTPVPKK